MRLYSNGRNLVFPSLPSCVDNALVAFADSRLLLPDLISFSRYPQNPGGRNQGYTLHQNRRQDNEKDEMEDDKAAEIEALRRRLLELSQSIVEHLPQIPNEVTQFLDQVEDPRIIVYTITSNMRMEVEDQLKILLEDNLREKMGYLAHLMADADGFVPWLYPFVQYDFSQSEPGVMGILRLLLTDPIKMSTELALSAWAVGSCLDMPIGITQAQRRT